MKFVLSCISSDYEFIGPKVAETTVPLYQDMFLNLGKF